MSTAKRITCVAVLANMAYKGHRSLMKGIVNYARAHGSWRFLVGGGSVNDPRFDCRRFRPDGAILANTQIAEISQFHRLGIPCVLTDSVSDEEVRQYRIGDIPVVSKDSHAIGKLAADHFLGRRFSNFAFVPDPLVRPWSRERCDGFCHTLRLAGYACAIYRPPRANAHRSWLREQPFLTKFLTALPKPAAVFAANDLRARQVMDACAEAGICVPTQISVLGVDNDECICETCQPMLSSISTGGEQRGYEAARILDELMAGRKVRARPLPQEPEAIVERDSTAYGTIHNALLGKAYFFIHEEALRRKISVRDVVAAMHCSRRYAERLFLEQLGIGIKDEIDRVRFNRVKELLLTTNLTTAEIASLCFFPSEAALYAQFHRRYGLSMRQFRRQA